MAPEVGFEPTTNRLTADRSTTELLWNHELSRSTERREVCALPSARQVIWLRGLDLNQRPSGYEPDELPGCSTPRIYYGEMEAGIKSKSSLHVRIRAFAPFGDEPIDSRGENGQRHGT